MHDFCPFLEIAEFSCALLGGGDAERLLLVVVKVRRVASTLAFWDKVGFHLQNKIIFEKSSICGCYYDPDKYFYMSIHICTKTIRKALVLRG